ncbi:GH25 family lysozyme [Faecalispora anaeroviscerum]|uniref:GH25 family lysozyme n=1 Tax=Faecalispora anaeroviscerum TaxID=2991836 RepID=UPI0024BBD4C3|nr:GH25 family lysozyme [Faecalispora anaeroviscerum]
MRRRLGSFFLVLAMLTTLFLPAYADTYTTDFMISSTFAQMKKGDTIQLRVYSGTSEATQVTWASSNPTVVQVDSTGTVTALTIGQATVTATSASGATVSCSVSCLVNVGIPGIDVSQHRGAIDWQKVKAAGIQFAMIRTGYGNENWAQQKDTQFEANYKGATANGIAVGAYHYSYATNATMAAQEAEMCLSILNGRTLQYPVVFDVEDKAHNSLSADQMGQIVNAFCSRIKQAGYKTAVYSYVNFYNARLTSPLVTQYDTWIAHWGVSQPNFSRPYTMWQYAAQSVPGVNGLCDMNYSYYDYAGTASQQPTKPTDPSFFASSAPSTYTFTDLSSDYFYRITTADAVAPTAVSSDPNVAEVRFSQQSSDGYIFHVIHKGEGHATITTTSAVTGTSTSFTVTGNALPKVVYFTDLGSAFTLQKGQTRSLRVMPTVLTGSIKFLVGNPSVLTGGTVQSTTGGWYYPITAASSGTTPIYAQVGNRAPVLVATVTVS